MDPQLKTQLQQLIGISYTSSTANIYGEVQVGSVATVFGRVEQHTREYELSNGTVERSLTMIILDADSTTGTPTFESRFYLPNTSVSTAAMARRPHIIQIAIDEYGKLDHWEISV